MLTGEVKTLFVAKKINNDYLIVKNFVEKKNDFFRTFWVPQGSHFSYASAVHPLADWSIFSNIEINNVAEQVIERKLTPGEVQARLMSKSYANFLLDIFSVKYVFIPLRDSVNDDDLFLYELEGRKYYIAQLDKLPYLSKINIGTKDIVAYENKNYKPHIYVTENQESININQPYIKINYAYVNPTRYTFSIKNVSKPFYLNFSENYNLGWSMKIGNFNWLDALIKKNYFVLGKNHFQNNAGLNSFYLNPNQICKVQSCKSNEDGSYDISGTLYFAPQSYMYFGLIISGSALVVILSYLVFIFGKYIKNERKN